jgi:hypothetical protein
MAGVKTAGFICLILIAGYPPHFHYLYGHKDMPCFGIAWVYNIERPSIENPEARWCVIILKILEEK